MSSFGDGFSSFSSNNNHSRSRALRDTEELEQKLAKAEADNRSLTLERDQAIDDLGNVETAFSDLHKRYERAKTTMDNLKQNEELLKTRDALLLKKVEQRDKQLEKLREEVTQTLERMYTDYEKKAQNAETENTRLRALVRKSEMKISTLESDLEQKTKENSQLHVLCDDLINGGSGGGDSSNGKATGR